MLCGILNVMDATGNLARWRIRLSAVDSVVVHRAGVEHHAADALSALPTTKMDESPLEDDVPLLTIAEAQPKEKKQRRTQKCA